MGNPNSEAPSSAQSITHFSHPHPLHLLNPQALGGAVVISLHCSACKLDAATAAAVYACVSCNFALHPKCAELPQQITHPFDGKHPFSLYPKPVYPEGLFNCDACGHRGGGFSYHCSPCGLDLHTTCASLPLTLAHHLHHHPLALTFSAPYAGNSFSCDICKKLGSKTWIYRCPACEFDVHLTCVAAVVPAPQVVARSTFVAANQYPQPKVGGSYGGYGAPPPQIAAAPFVPNSYPQPGVAAGKPGYGRGKPVSGLGDQVVIAAAEGIASGIAQSATQALFQGFFGGGGGGGNASCVDVVVMDGGAQSTTIDGDTSYYDESY